MRRILSIPSAATVLAAGVLAGMTALPATAAAAEPFHADSGDACPRATTDGTLAWHNGASVEVTGNVLDRPAKQPPSGSLECDTDDGYYAVASFRLYDSGTVADSATETVDNGTAKFDFTLTDPGPVVGAYDVLVVQVCRSPSAGEAPTYCGKPISYHPDAGTS